MIGSREYTTPIELKQQQNKPRLKKYYFLLPIIVIVAIVIGVTQTQNKELPVISLYQFTQKLTKNDELLDQDHYDNSYTIYDNSQRYFNIEIYENESLAKQRYQQLDEINGYISEIDSSAQFEKFLAHVQSPYFISESYVEKNVIIAFDRGVDQSIKDQYLHTFQKLLKQYTVEPSQSHLLEIETLSTDIIKKRFIRIMQKADEMLAIQMLEHKINQEAVEKDYVYLKDIPMFEKYYQRWHQYVVHLKSNSFEGSELQKTLQKELKEKVYEEGNYVVGQDILSGYYIAVSQNHPQMNEIYQQYSWQQDTIFYLKDEQKVSVSKNIKLYSLDHSPKLNLDGYTSGVFKVGQHIEPGTYELTAQSLYPCDYWIVDQSGLSDFINQLSRKYSMKSYQKVKNNQTKTIVLKENQYLFLINGQLEKK